MTTATDIPSVNFHFWQPCNMRCGFCFAQFLDVKDGILPKGHLGRTDCIAVVRLIAAAGFEKINFAGGEPALCPWLPELLRAAQQSGMTTSIVTNGTKITGEWLDAAAGWLDWLTLSVDTTDPERNLRSGRATTAGPLTEPDYLQIVNLAQARSIRLKINTVVSADNYDDDLTGFISKAQPERWKIFQALPVAGQNDAGIARAVVTDAQFDAYISRHQAVAANGIAVVPESNDLMRGSYLMIGPAGRFFDNTQGGHRYSRPILEVGIAEALQDVAADVNKFLRRGGLYDWHNARAA